MKNLSKLLFLIFLLILIFSTILSASDKPYNYRETWNSWTDYQRYIYLWGFNDARNRILFDVLFEIKRESGELESRWDEEPSFFDLKKMRNIIQKIQITDDLIAIRDIMTCLYEDPANAYIFFGSMISIASDKLSGEPIENRLPKERKAIKEVEEIMRNFITK